MNIDVQKVKGSRAVFVLVDVAGRTYEEPDVLNEEQDFLR